MVSALLSVTHREVMMWVLLSLGICLLATQSYAGPSAACEEHNWPLCDYVHRDDGFWEYSVYDVIINEELEVTSYYINMTSQKWKDEEWTNTPVWWHHQVVHVPHNNLRYPENGFIYVSGRSNTNSPPDPGTNHNNKTLHMAAAGGFITSVLFHTPNQPMIFTNDSRQQERREDDAIAWTWRVYADMYEEDPDTADPEVILRMPMCKGVVRAMDTIQDLMSSLEIADVQSFMLAGESKRGWTTWMTAPIDDRVVAMAPVVLSSLNMQENFHHYYQSFGGWPLYFWDYWNKNIMGRIDDPGMDGLVIIADPYSYRAGMTMPTLIVSSTSDEFFLIDDTHYFLDNLPGNNKYFWLLEDSGHSISNSPRNEDLWKMLETFYISVITDFDRPQMSWEREAPEEREGTGAIRFSTDVDPLDIMAFSAQSVVDDRRDWRTRVRCDIADVCGEKPTNITWARIDVEDLGDGEFSVEYDVPEDGFLAFYMQMRYAGPEGRDMWFTTEANIIPDYFPYEDCTGRNCTGILK